MSSPDHIIVAQVGGETNCDPDRRVKPQAFTIRCAECDGDGGHLPDCPCVIAAGFEYGDGAQVTSVFGGPGRTISSHPSAMRALAFYSMVGPVELHWADGTVLAESDLEP